MANGRIQSVTSAGARPGREIPRKTHQHYSDARERRSQRPGGWTDAKVLRLEFQREGRHSISAEVGSGREVRPLPKVYPVAG
jgi:hypothetical protein